MTSLTVIREVITSTLLVLDVVLAIFLGGYLVKIGRLEGWRTAYVKIENQAAIGLMVLLIGHGIIRAWSLSLIWNQIHGRYVGMSFYHTALLGLAVAVVGKICLVRVFSKQWTGDWGWIAGIILAIIAVCLILLY